MANKSRLSYYERQVREGKKDWYLGCVSLKYCYMTARFYTRPKRGRPRKVKVSGFNNNGEF